MKRWNDIKQPWIRIQRVTVYFPFPQHLSRIVWSRIFQWLPRKNRLAVNEYLPVQRHALGKCQEKRCRRGITRCQGRFVSTGTKARDPVNYERRVKKEKSTHGPEWESKEDRNSNRKWESEREKKGGEERNVRRIMWFRFHSSEQNRVKKFVPVLANFRFVPLLFPLLSTLVQFSRERVKPRQRDVFDVSELLVPLECTLRYLRILTTSTITILYAVRFWDKAEFVRELSRGWILFRYRF